MDFRSGQTARFGTAPSGALAFKGLVLKPRDLPMGPRIRSAVLAASRQVEFLNVPS